MDDNLFVVTVLHTRMLHFHLSSVAGSSPETFKVLPTARSRWVLRCQSAWPRYAYRRLVSVVVDLRLLRLQRLQRLQRLVTAELHALDPECRVVS